MLTIAEQRGVGLTTIKKNVRVLTFAPSLTSMLNGSVMPSRLIMFVMNALDEPPSPQMNIVK